MPIAGLSPLSQMLGLRVDTATGGAGDLLQQVKDQTGKKKKLGAYPLSEQEASQFSALTQWLVRNGQGL
jgi:hypothetical protein